MSLFNRRTAKEQKKVADQMGWAEGEDFGWDRIRNPEAHATRQQNISRLILILVLLSLPFSLVSCLVAFTATQSGSEAPVTVESYEHPWEPQASIAAEEGVKRWLAESGMNPVWLRSIRQTRSILSCDPAGAPACEEHLLIVEIDDGVILRIGALLHPDTAEFRTPPWIIGYGGETSDPWNDEASRLGSTTTPTWSVVSPKAELPDNAEQALVRWARTWVEGTPEQLQQLSLYPERRDYTTMADGWEFVEYGGDEASLQILDWATLEDPNTGDSVFVITVSFDVTPDWVDCYSGFAAERPPEDTREACPDPLTIAADVRLEVGTGSGALPRVTGYSPPGQAALPPDILEGTS